MIVSTRGCLVVTRGEHNMLRSTLRPLRGSAPSAHPIRHYSCSWVCIIIVYCVLVFEFSLKYANIYSIIISLFHLITLQIVVSRFCIIITVHNYKYVSCVCVFIVCRIWRMWECLRRWYPWCIKQSPNSLTLHVHANVVHFIPTQ